MSEQAGGGQTQGGAAGGTQGAGAGAGAGAAGDGFVPSSRLREETAARDAARAEVATLRTELETLKKGGSSDLVKAQAELDGWRKKEATWLEERAALSHGLTDPEAQVVARTLYGQLAEKDRPAFGDWLGGLKADPTKAPRSLAPWLTPLAGTGAGASGQAATTRSAPAGGQQPDAAGGSAGGASLTDAAIDAVIDRCKRSNDWTEYDKIRDQVLARAVPTRR